MALPAGPARGAAGDAVDTKRLLNLDEFTKRSQTQICRNAIFSQPDSCYYKYFNIVDPMVLMVVQL